MRQPQKPAPLRKLMASSSSIPLCKGRDEAAGPIIQTFIIPHELPTMNEMLDAKATVFKGKRGASAYTKMKKDADRQVAWLARAQLQPVTTYPVSLHIHWGRKNRRHDKDNIAAGIKFLLDGLVFGGIIEGDGWKHIENWSNSFDVDKTEQQVIVTITEGMGDGADDSNARDHNDRIRGARDSVESLTQ